MRFLDPFDTLNDSVIYVNTEIVDLAPNPLKQERDIDVMQSECNLISLE